MGSACRTPIDCSFWGPASRAPPACRWQCLFGNGARYPKDLRASKFNTDLANYIASRKDALGEQLTPEKAHFEDFIRYLDIEHYLDLRGSDTWSTEGNEGTIVTKYFIGKFLARHLNNLKAIPDLYLDFARRLDPYDHFPSRFDHQLVELSTMVMPITACEHVRASYGQILVTAGPVRRRRLQAE